MLTIAATIVLSVSDEMSSGSALKVPRAKALHFLA